MFLWANEVLSVHVSENSKRNAGKFTIFIEIFPLNVCQREPLHTCDFQFFFGTFK